MKVLALDTTSEFGSLALRAGGQTIAEIAIHSREGFAHLIFPAIEELLASAGLGLADIDCFAAAAGPGSFTGVRVGLAAVKGLAEALGKTAAGVSNLRALAWFGRSTRRAVVLEARRGQVYAAIYDAQLQPVGPEMVLELKAWLGSLNETEHEFIADAGIRNQLAGTRFASMPFVEAPRELAAAIAACGESFGGSDPAALDANYVRQSDAELFWKDG